MGSKNESFSFTFYSQVTLFLMCLILSALALLARSGYWPWNGFTFQFVVSFCRHSHFVFSFMSFAAAVGGSLRFVSSTFSMFSFLKYVCFLFLWLWSKAVCCWYVCLQICSPTVVVYMLVLLGWNFCLLHALEGITGLYQFLDKSSCVMLMILWFW